MLKKIRFFYFSDSALGYQEVKYFKTKAALSGLLLAIVLSSFFLVLNSFLGDPLGVSRKTDLAVENRILKEQLRDLTRKAATVQQGMNTLAERTNQLRLMVDLRQIDDQTRKASIGGALTGGAEFAYLSREANKVLTHSLGLLSQLEREVELQKKSYEEIQRQYEHNKTFFKHIPAIKPCQGPYSLSGFGMRIHPVLGVWRMHEGLDIISDVGTPVYASGDAVVKFAGRTQGGYGAVIELDHGYGYTSLYAHLSQIHVNGGQKVKRGELIGKVGRSGLVSGPHLHYEIRLNGRNQNPVDFFFDDVDAARYRTQLASAK